MKITEATTQGELMMELVRLGVTSVSLHLDNGQDEQRVAIYARHVLPPDPVKSQIDSRFDGVISVRGDTHADALNKMCEAIERALAARIERIRSLGGPVRVHEDWIDPKVSP